MGTSFFRCFEFRAENGGFRFQFYLSQRGFYGQVIIKHDDGSLTLRVQTDDQRAKNGKSHEKDAKVRLQNHFWIRG